MAKPPPCPHADQLPPSHYVCADCKRERKRIHDRAAYAADPEPAKRRATRYYEEHREEKQAYNRAYHQLHREQANAERRARYWADHEHWLEYKRRERERIQADPRRRAALAEYHRMYERLRREREGRPREPVPEEAYPAASPKWTLPADPLRAVVTGWLTEHGCSKAELAMAAGVSERLVGRLLREGGNGVTVAAADRLLVTMGLHLDLIYGETETCR